MTTWDWEKIGGFLEALVIIWGFISGGIVLWLRGQFVTRKTYDAEVRRIDAAIAEGRTTSKAESNALALSLAALNATLGRLDEREIGMKAALMKMDATVVRIEGFLLMRGAAP